LFAAIARDNIDASGGKNSMITLVHLYVQLQISQILRLDLASEVVIDAVQEIWFAFIESTGILEASLAKYVAFLLLKI